MTVRHTLTALASAAVLTLGAGTVSAAAFPDFVVDWDMNAGTPNSFTADKIVGGYVEVITFTPTGATTGTFDFALRYIAGQFFADDGTTGLGAGVTRLGVDYNLYALVTGSGTYSQAGFATTFTTNAGGSIEMLYDLGANTAFTNSGAAVVDQATLFARSGFGTDMDLLDSGSALYGSGTLDPTLPGCDPGINCGSFGQSSIIDLSAAGRNFFTSPVPFYELAFNSGQLNNFDPSGTQVINGSMDLVFNRIPEPGSLALVGLALGGLGMFSRRRKD